MRRSIVLGLLVLVICLSAGTAVAAHTDGGSTVPSLEVAPTDTDRDDCEPVVDGDRRSQPESDELGWANGCWYDDPLDIDQTDGLRETELRAVVSRSMARVEHIRELQFEEDVEVTIMSREELQETVFNQTYDESLRTFDNVKFEAMFLIDKDADSIEVQDENRGVAVLGFYRPETDELVLVAEEPDATVVDEGTLAHELTHALQDQHFNLSHPRFNGTTRDEHNAIAGVVEGDANLVQFRYMEQRCDNPDHAWNGTCVRPPDDGGPGGNLANIGVYFIDFQPYSDGPSFIGTIYRQGGWDAVNELFDELPQSAEQVIHPDKYLVDEPTNVSLSDRTTDEWDRVRPPDRPDHAEVGQTGIASMFVFPLYDSQGVFRDIVGPQDWLNYTATGEVSPFDPLQYDIEPANGWDGDRMHVYQNTGNETAYVWRIVWDSPEDAVTFVENYERVIRYWGGDDVADDTYRIPADRGFRGGYHVDRDGDTVTIVNAPTVERLPDVRTSLELETETPTPTPSDGTTPTPTPSDGATPTPTATPEPIPGFGLGIAIVAAFAASILAYRRR